MTVALIMASLAIQQPAQASENILTEYRFMQVERSADRRTSASTWLGDLNRAIKADMLPAAIRKGEGRGSVMAALKVAADGSTGPCTVDSGDPAIGKAVCALLSPTGALPISYAAPEEPVARDWLISFDWVSRPISGPSTSRLSYDGLSPVPPPPPRSKGWPPIWGNSNLVLRDTPSPPTLISALQKVRKPGVVGLEAIVSAMKATPRCEIRASSGQPDLDTLACDLAKDIRFSFAESCANCDRDMQQGFLFKFSKSNVEVKMASSNGRMYPIPATRPSISAKTVRLLMAALPGRPHMSLRVSVDADGRIVDCAANAPLSPDLAKRVCKEASSARFQPALDGFGDPMIAETSIPLRLLP